MNKTLWMLAGAATLALGFAAPAHADPEANMKKAGCFACHAVDKKLVGPSYKDVAAKYKGQADAVAKLTEKSRKGGKGVWGPVPMPPNPVSKISDADLKAAVEWILKQ
jgi:cytochrome c